MDLNTEMLENWYSNISDYEQLNFSEAQKLYFNYQQDGDVRKRTRLIEGTLYVIYNFIKNILYFLVSSSYDMDDILNTCGELWIEKLDLRRLLE